MTMFDLTPYGGPERPPKPTPKTPDPVAIELGVGGWGLVIRAKHPEAHILLDTASADRFKRDSTIPIGSSAAITRCGLAVTPLTHEPGTLAAACRACIDRNGGHT